MNINLRHEISFSAAIYMPDLADAKLQVARYKTQFNLVTASDDFHEINVAMDRVKTFATAELWSTVFLHSSHDAQIKTFTDLGIKYTTLPEEPLDQIIGMMLYCKFNAMMEGRMQVMELDLCSDIGDHVWYQHFADDNLGPFADSGWWHHPGPHHVDMPTDEKKISMLASTSWNRYQLNWAESSDASDDTVVYADFRRNET